ncbi:unnamed protein product [Caenorhabditis auriculariae]|uniref:Uncharacterized protein n=1 Tax=Caenorhabditis auriculariae TaxID=2777116 RepID=A0A8S1H1R3_9PELO|nr:unnamed protein product [Caenorhabditis auriculariae]
MKRWLVELPVQTCHVFDAGAKTAMDSVLCIIMLHHFKSAFWRFSIFCTTVYFIGFISFVTKPDISASSVFKFSVGLGHGFKYMDEINFTTKKQKDTVDDNLLKMARNWNGQLSLAIYTSSHHSGNTSSDSSIDNVIRKIFQLTNCFEPIAEALDAHLFFTTPEEEDCPEFDISFPARWASCDDSLKPLEKFRFSHIGGSYPVNVARNIARKEHEAEYVLLADMEQEYSSNAEENLRNEIKKLDIRKNKYALAIRRFEYDESREPPKTLEELREAYGKTAYVFHYFFWRQGHWVPGLKKWLRGAEEQTRIIDIRKMWVSSWEPMFVAHNSIPYHNEDLSYGLDNQVALALHMCCAGYQFAISENVFSMHKGIRRRSQRRHGVSGAAFRHGARGLRLFYRKMAEQYPERARRCLKNRYPKRWMENRKTRPNEKN